MAPLPSLPSPLPQTRPDELVGRVSALQEELKAAAKQLAEAKSALAVAKSQVRAAWRHCQVATGSWERESHACRAHTRRDCLGVAGQAGMQ